MTIEIREYVAPDGRNPFRSWSSSLPDAHALKVDVALRRIEEGNTSSIKWFDGLGEVRIDWGPGLRIYLTQRGGRLILLIGGGDKSTQARDIKKAKAILDELKRSRNKTEK